MKEIIRMNQLAGLITEGQARKMMQVLNENKSFTPEDNVNFKWKNKPANPESMLTDTESGDEFSKGEYWENDIIGRDPEEIFPSYGTENSDGTWTLTFDEGEFSGFVEGEDFTI
jgi:hypothetical protein